MEYQPIDRHILCKKAETKELESKNKCGIIIPGQGDTKNLIWLKVVALGDLIREEDESVVEVGDVILVDKNYTEEIFLAGEGSCYLTRQDYVTLKKVEKVIKKKKKHRG